MRLSNHVVILVQPVMIPLIIQLPTKNTDRLTLSIKTNVVWLIQKQFIIAV